MAALRRYDVLLVNPIRDGLNLVAKEGALVNERDGLVALSPEAGAWAELSSAVRRVHPYDISGTADALADGPGHRPVGAGRGVGRPAGAGSGPHAGRLAGRPAGGDGGLTGSTTDLRDRPRDRPQGRARASSTLSVPAGPSTTRSARSRSAAVALRAAHRHPQRDHPGAGQRVEGVEGRQVAHVVADEDGTAPAPRPARAAQVPLSTSMGGWSS